jgi:UDP-glucose 4-epimerase
MARLQHSVSPAQRPRREGIGMKILFTGASSFTGYWFVRELAAAGHDVVTTFRQQPERYVDVRRTRVEMTLATCRAVFGCSFGDDRFLQLIREDGPWDLLCHHAAETANYKSDEFDVHKALEANTHRLREVLWALREAGCGRVLLTGSIFEGGEGAGSEGLPAFSPYGLSKGFTAQLVRYHAAALGMGLGKFVVPNPFGPYEEARFTTYLAKSWFAGSTPVVRSPAYVRDNIHVSLLAKIYREFAASLSAPGYAKVNPIGYAESQGSFACRFAGEMRRLLGMKCPIEIAQQIAFDEPQVRINTDVPDVAKLGWDEDTAWRQLAAYYRGAYGRAGAVEA